MSNKRFCGQSLVWSCPQWSCLFGTLVCNVVVWWSSILILVSLILHHTVWWSQMLISGKQSEHWWQGFAGLPSPQATSKNSHITQIQKSTKTLKKFQRILILKLKEPLVYFRYVQTWIYDDQLEGERWFSQAHVKCLAMTFIRKDFSIVRYFSGR